MSTQLYTTYSLLAVTPTSTLEERYARRARWRTLRNATALLGPQKPRDRGNLLAACIEERERPLHPTRPSDLGGHDPPLAIIQHQRLPEINNTDPPTRALEPVLRTRGTVDDARIVQALVLRQNRVSAVSR